MVDAVGSNVGRVNERRVAQVSRVATTPAATPVASEPASSTATLASALAAGPPVNSDRVRIIKAAVESGSFPISPATIADRLIAARYEWMSNDQA